MLFFFQKVCTSNIENFKKRGCLYVTFFYSVDSQSSIKQTWYGFLYIVYINTKVRYVIS